MPIKDIQEVILYTEKIKVKLIMGKKQDKKLFLSAFFKNQKFGVKVQLYCE